MNGAGGPQQVLIDASDWDNPRGEGRCLRGLLPALAQALPDLTLSALAGAAQLAAIGDATEGRVGGIGSEDAAAATAKLTAGRSRSVRELAALARQVRASGADVVLQPSIVGWYPTPGVPQVLGVHDLKPWRLSREMFSSRRAAMAFGLKQRWALRSAAGVYTFSEPTRRSVAARLGSSEAEVALAPPAVEAAFAPRSQAEVDQALRLVGLAPGDGFFVYAGGLNRHKDPLTLLEAFALRRRAGDRRDLVLAGAWSGLYGSIGEELRRTVGHLGLTDAVSMPGHVGDDVLAALYSSCDALVSTSRFEGLGLPPLEAAACGAQLVLSDIPAHRHTSEGRAVFFPVGDPDALAVALARVDAREHPSVPHGGGPESPRITDPARGPRYSWESAATAVAGCIRAALAAASRSSATTATRSRSLR